MARLFVAIELSRDAADAIARAAKMIAGRYPDARPVPKQNLHLSLAFLGHTSFADRIVASVKEAVAPMKPPALRTADAGAFPSLKRARVVWAGIGGDVEQLEAVTKAVEAAIEPWGFEPEDRPFTPHVTIARMRMPETIDLSGVGIDPVAFTASEVTVFESKLQRPAPVYTALCRAPLGG